MSIMFCSVYGRSCLGAVDTDSDRKDVGPVVSAEIICIYIHLFEYVSIAENSPSILN